MKKLTLIFISLLSIASIHGIDKVIVDKQGAYIDCRPKNPAHFPRRGGPAKRRELNNVHKPKRYAESGETGCIPAERVASPEGGKTEPIPYYDGIPHRPGNDRQKW